MNNAVLLNEVLKTSGQYVNNKNNLELLRISNVAWDKFLIGISTQSMGLESMDFITELDKTTDGYEMFFKNLADNDSPAAQVWNIMTKLLDYLGIGYKSYNEYSGRIFIDR